MTTTKLPELPDIKWLTLDNIDAIDRKRSLNRNVIDRLKDSIARIGLKTPLSVRFISQDQNWRLVTGHHRLQACIELGMECAREGDAICVTWRQAACVERH